MCSHEFRRFFFVGFYSVRRGLMCSDEFLCFLWELYGFQWYSADSGVWVLMRSCGLVWVLWVAVKSMSCWVFFLMFAGRLPGVCRANAACMRGLHVGCMRRVPVCGLQVFIHAHMFTH